jgi:hypothetical protein
LDRNTAISSGATVLITLGHFSVGMPHAVSKWQTIPLACAPLSVRLAPQISFSSPETWRTTSVNVLWTVR